MSSFAIFANFMRSLQEATIMDKSRWDKQISRTYRESLDLQAGKEYI